MLHSMTSLNLLICSRFFFFFFFNIPWNFHHRKLCYLKIMFVQRRQDSCLVARDTSGFSSRLGRAIGTLLDFGQIREVIFLFL